ncbi:MAG TPA: hypothetical protein VGP24_11480 [Glaciihabitans sp.]|jgi:hypothetical protein|nr:hypothetical protein [Glaciihabitans sp.]
MQCDLTAGMQSLGLNDVVGREGPVWLTSWLHYGLIKNHENFDRTLDMDAYVDLFRRPLTPWYEEARSYFQSETTQERWGDAMRFIITTQNPSDELRKRAAQLASTPWAAE